MYIIWMYITWCLKPTQRSMMSHSSSPEKHYNGLWSGNYTQYEGHCKKYKSHTYTLVHIHNYIQKS